MLTPCGYFYNKHVLLKFIQHCANILVDFKLLVCLFSEAQQEQEMPKPSSEDLSNLVQSGVDKQSYQPVGDIKTHHQPSV